MTEGKKHIVIVGAGHAGGIAAMLLRQYGFGGDIALVGEETIAPYQRPPLSKAFLKGQMAADALKLKPDHYYQDQNIELKLGTPVIGIDRAAKTVAVAGLGNIHYDTLIIATGSRARKLAIPGNDLQGLHELRSVADAEGLKAALGPGRRLAIVGGGYIGLEVAASAIALGAQAVVVEREARVLARVACETLSNFFDAYHRARGVDILVDAQVAGFEGGDGTVDTVVLADGRRIECDAALIGVGAVPCDELARQAGLRCEQGIVVDDAARTSDPAIFAIGDVTWRPMPLYDRMFRLESVPNALEQAKQAVNAILDRLPPAPEVPWFWSDQYDLKLQIAGIPFDADRIVVRGSVDAAKFALFHLKGATIQAVEAVNAPAEFMAGKQLIGQRKAVDPAKLGDITIPMKEVVA